MQPAYYQAAPTQVVLMNLDQNDLQNLALYQQQSQLQELNFGDFLRKTGNTMKTISKEAAPIYKGAKEAIYAGGNAWKSVDPNSYAKYGKPVGDAMYEGKEMGKSMGGWKAFD